jgi:hypothetical protein
MKEKTISQAFYVKFSKEVNILEYLIKIRYLGELFYLYTLHYNF